MARKPSRWGRLRAMTPNEIRAALRALPESERQRIARALRRHPEPHPLYAVAILEGDAVVNPAEESADQRSGEEAAAALLGARRVLDALLGAELSSWVWAALLGQNGRPPPHLRRPAARAVAKLRRALFATNGEGPCR